MKTGISHARLRPTLAVIDPDLTRTQPAGVTAASGMDILDHALESWTARWYATNERKTAPARVPYCGANPISDMWAEKALTLLAGSFLGIPNGIGAVGYGEGDVGALVDGAVKQQRLLATCPKDVTEDDLAGIFRRSLELW